jgi:hypothetical protein
MTKKSGETKRTCKKCGKPIDGKATFVATGEHSASGPYHRACASK